MSEDLLFELGTEEIPPAFLPKVASNLRDDVRDGLHEERLDFEGVELFYTPRRIAIRVTGLQERQEDRVEKHRGPSEDIGLDESGDYTIAAKKFAQGKGGTEDDLYVEETEDGTYFFVDEKIEGVKASELLPDLLASVVKDLDQPEKMRWDDSSVRFIRPIRWLVCLLGSDPVGLVIGNVKASDYTRGHRFHGEERVDLDEPKDYEKELRKNYVMPDPEARKEKMEVQFSEIAEELNASMASDEGFIELLSNTLEYPSSVCGSFPDEFLNLPDELLFKTLTGEARLVPLVDSEGAPISTFVGFRDGPVDETDRVKRGYESVINARLRDSKFFFSHDREQPLEGYREDLKKVTFQEDLGSILDKVNRMKEIARKLSSIVEQFDPDLVDRTVELCKADLVTEVVDEFPSLEGTIGAYYAELDGEPEEVVEGIRHHYQPRSAGDDPPEHPAAIAASIADKLDTLFGSFLIGERPTGTKDPYGLRRKTDGIIRTAIDREIDMDLSDLIEYSGSLYDDMTETDTAATHLEGYFRERLGRVLERLYDIPYDVVEAVNLGDSVDLYGTYLRAKTLEKFKNRREMKDLVDSFTRIVNITEGRENSDFDPEIFELSEEKELWDQVSRKKDEIDTLARNRSYEEMVEKLLALKDPLDEYFDNVMVMAEDEKQRENRLGFLLHLKKPFLKLGDLSKIVTE